jgi:hypothetical protein
VRVEAASPDDARASFVPVALEQSTNEARSRSRFAEAD